MGYESIFSKSPMELFEWLESEFSVQTPREVISVPDMNHAATLLLQLSEYYTYLVALSSYAKIRTRDIKRNGTKEEYEDAVDKKEAIANATDVIKQQYAAVSRAVTIKIENNAELRMNSSGSIRG